MRLTPVTHVRRFVSIDGTTVVRVGRCRIFLDGYADPPRVEDERETWGVCSDDNRDYFREMGALRAVLKAVAPRAMVAAAAAASPTRFAEMVAEAHGLGRVTYVASEAVWSGHVQDVKRFCSIDVDRHSLKFHVLRTPALTGKQRRRPGVYSVSYSLVDFRVQSRLLAAELSE